MNGLRSWIIVTWISLPTVMYGGYSLLRLLNRGNVLTPFQVGWFRAGHAHAGVLLVMALLYDTFMDATSLSFAIKTAGCAVLAVRHPRAIRRLLRPHDGRTAEPEFGRNDHHDGRRRALDVRHRRARLWPDRHALIADIAQFTSKLIGSFFGPLTKVACVIFISPSSATDFSRGSSSSNRMRISILARYWPRQRCAP